MFESTLLTAKDVAQILRISKALAYRLVTDGQLPAVRFGRTVRIRQEDLQAFVVNNLTCKDKLRSIVVQ
jgi:excisionase family DNA binding protein